MRKHWKYLFASSLMLALLVTTGAVAAGEGQPLLGGDRNPGSNKSLELQNETQIIANTQSYGTRQSNKSDNGGGAIYGCRSGAGGSPANNEPCVRANNLSAGYAFEFETDGVLGGTIAVAGGGDSVKPFVTNATGVATGLNADEVDGQSAEDIEKAAVERAIALDVFAKVAADGRLEAARGVTGAERTGDGTYLVTFASDVSKCSAQVQERGTDDPGPTSADPVDGEPTKLRVRTFDGVQPTVIDPTSTQQVRTDGNALADRDFDLTLTC